MAEMQEMKLDLTKYFDGRFNEELVKTMDDGSKNINKRFDDVDKRFDSLDQRVEAFEKAK